MSKDDYTKGRLDECLDKIELLERRQEQELAVAAETSRELKALREEVLRICMHDEQIYLKRMVQYDTLGNMGPSSRTYTCAVCNKVLLDSYSGEFSREDSALIESWKAEGRVIIDGWQR